jgi:hypothetical protein
LEFLEQSHSDEHFTIEEDDFVHVDPTSFIQKIISDYSSIPIQQLLNDLDFCLCFDIEREKIEIMHANVIFQINILFIKSSMLKIHHNICSGLFRKIILLQSDLHIY